MYTHEFIDMVKANPMKWICYCEIIIDDLGRIELANPSHVEKLVEMVCNKRNMSKEELYDHIGLAYSPLHWIVSKEKYISVWYSTIIRPERINRLQKRTIDLLVANDIICDKYEDMVTREYQKWLKFGSLK